MKNDAAVLQGEALSHKLSMEFDSQEAAEAAVQKLNAQAEIAKHHMRIVYPNDPDLSQKLEPEPKGIAKTLVKTHVVFGFVGLLLGLVLATFLVTVGPAITASSPVVTFIAVGFFALSLGLLAAGFVSLRPDHDPLIEKTREASDKGCFIVVAHCQNLEQYQQAKSVVSPDMQTL